MLGRRDPRSPQRFRSRRRRRAGAVIAGVALSCAALVGLWPASRAGATTVVPAYDHVFVVADSGQPAAAVIGPAAYLTSLAAANTLATAYTAVDPSPLADRL